MAQEPTNLYDMIAVQNLDDEDFTFHVDGSPYQIAAGEVRIFPRFMARIAVKHLITKILNKRDPEGKQTKNMAKREALASQIVIEEKPIAMPVRRSQDEINREMVAKMNETSELDSILKRRRGAEKSTELAQQVDGLGNPVGNEPLIPPPAVRLDDVTPPADPTPAKKGSKGAAKVVPTETNEDGASKLPAQIKDNDTTEPKFKVPSREVLLAYAKNDLKLDMTDKKTLAEFEKLTDEDLAIELAYPMDEEE